MNKEIGGYFELEKLVNKEYYPNFIALNTARNALLYLLKARNIAKLYIPYFLCNSIVNLLEKEQYQYEYYFINKQFLPEIKSGLKEKEFIYIVNYFGQITNKKLLQLQEQYKNIIIDNVQAFFQKPIQGIDTIYSCRKFFGVSDGAYLATEAKLEESLDVDVSKNRMIHLLGRFEGSATEYYQNFKENDKSFTDIPLRYMSKLTHNILGAIDYQCIKKKRNENYRILAEELESYNPLSLRLPNGPYCYPFYCEEGLKVKKVLAEKKIYVPTLWPNVLTLEGTLEKDYAENILPLPCDQRYDKKDMKQIAREIENYLDGNKND